jgi:hypothetical protein
MEFIPEIAQRLSGIQKNRLDPESTSWVRDDKN